MKGYTEESDSDVIKDTDNMSEQTGVEQSKSVFPCELAENPSDNIKIFIHGKNHTSEKDRKFVEKLILRGITGDIYVGLEGYKYGLIDDLDLTLRKYGLELNVEKSKVFGIEAHFANILAILPKNYIMLYRAVNGVFGEESRLSIYKMQLLYRLVNDPLIHPLWERIRRHPLSYPEDEELAVFIDEIVAIDRSNVEEWEAKLKTVQSQQVWTNNHSFIRFSQQIAMEFISSHRLRSPVTMPNLDSYYALLENPRSLRIEMDFANTIAVEWREAFFVKHIASIYCSALEERKSLWLSVGILHVDSLSNLLRTASSDQINIVDVTDR